MKRIFLSLVLAFAAAAQEAPNPLLAAKDAEQLTKRVVQLMESTAAAVPGLSKTSTILQENARVSMAALQANPQNAALTYDFLKESRAYLSLADAVPKPFPYPQAAHQQMGELRDSLDRLEAHLHALIANTQGQSRNPDRDNLKRYADANEKMVPPSAGRPRVVFMGDSITDGWRLNEYFTPRDFVNRGISGQVTGEMLGRMKADVLDVQPRAVLILAGTNDIARGTSLKAIENNLSMMADLAQAHNIRVLIASVLPVSDYHKDVNPRFEMTKTHPPATIVELNRWIEQFCRQHGATYVDYYSAMVDGSGMLPSDMAEDGLHPNAKGYRVMAPIALEALGRVLSPQGESRGRR